MFRTHWARSFSYAAALGAGVFLGFADYTHGQAGGGGAGGGGGGGSPGGAAGPGGSGPGGAAGTGGPMRPGGAAGTGAALRPGGAAGTGRVGGGGVGIGAGTNLGGGGGIGMQGSAGSPVSPPSAPSIPGAPGAPGAGVGAGVGGGIGGNVGVGGGGVNAGAGGQGLNGGNLPLVNPRSTQAKGQVGGNRGGVNTSRGPAQGRGNGRAGGNANNNKNNGAGRGASAGASGGGISGGVDAGIPNVPLNNSSTPKASAAASAAGQNDNASNNNSGGSRDASAAANANKGNNRNNKGRGDSQSNRSNNNRNQSNNNADDNNGGGDNGIIFDVNRDPSDTSFDTQQDQFERARERTADQIGVESPTDVTSPRGTDTTGAANGNGRATGANQARQRSAGANRANPNAANRSNGIIRDVNRDPSDTSFDTQQDRFERARQRTADQIGVESPTDVTSPRGTDTTGAANGNRQATGANQARQRSSGANRANPNAADRSNGVIFDVNRDPSDTSFDTQQDQFERARERTADQIGVESPDDVTSPDNQRSTNAGNSNLRRSNRTTTGNAGNATRRSAANERANANAADRSNGVIFDVNRDPSDTSFDTQQDQFDRARQRTADQTGVESPEDVTSPRSSRTTNDTNNNENNNRRSGGAAGTRDDGFMFDINRDPSDTSPDTHQDQFDRARARTAEQNGVESPEDVTSPRNATETNNNSAARTRGQARNAEGESGGGSGFMRDVNRDPSDATFETNQDRFERARQRVADQIGVDVPETPERVESNDPNADPDGLRSNTGTSNGQDFSRFETITGRDGEIRSATANEGQENVRGNRSSNVPTNRAGSQSNVDRRDPNRITPDPNRDSSDTSFDDLESRAIRTQEGRTTQTQGDGRTTESRVTEVERIEQIMDGFGSQSNRQTVRRPSALSNVPTSPSGASSRASNGRGLNRANVTNNNLNAGSSNNDIRNQAFDQRNREQRGISPQGGAAQFDNRIPSRQRQVERNQNAVNQQLERADNDVDDQRDSSTVIGSDAFNDESDTVDRSTTTTTTESTTVNGNDATNDAGTSPTRNRFGEPVPPSNASRTRSRSNVTPRTQTRGSAGAPGTAGGPATTGDATTGNTTGPRVQGLTPSDVGTRSTRSPREFPRSATDRNRIPADQRSTAEPVDNGVEDANRGTLRGSGTAPTTGTSTDGRPGQVDSTTTGVETSDGTDSTPSTQTETTTTTSTTNTDD